MQKKPGCTEIMHIGEHFVIVTEVGVAYGACPQCFADEFITIVEAEEPVIERRNP